ncbi:MAG: DUF3570 domain-containing protein [Gammaproteobacteria bacterium]|nr:DUF3570 domain-containing protein [Gammaproteobacteria bacterium]
MQLKSFKAKNIKGKLSLATCSLLQVTASVTQAADSEWDIDTAFLYYVEGDDRVSAFEPAIYAGRNFGDDGERIDLRLVVDVLTGATPNGAHSSSVVQTFTTPSGNSSYTVQPGEIPLDDSFKDTRVAAGADWTLPINRLSRVKLGLNASTEFDYLSLGVSGSYIRDLNNKNTTLTASLAFNNDTYTPEGGIPIALSPMRRANTGTNREGSSDTKTVTDFLVGLTQVINRHTLIEANYSYGVSDGYLSDPFKIVTVVDPVTGLPDNTALAAIDGDNLPYIYENRPDSRQRNNLFFRVAHHLTQDVIHLSYRYFWDDWGITSNTLDFKYRYEMGRSYLQPHVRYYMQDAADFYRHNLVQGVDVDSSGNVLLAEVSSDSRLAKFTSNTLGLKYGYVLGKDSELSIRGEFLKQTFDDGNVSSIEETPDLDAVILNIGYSARW